MDELSIVVLLMLIGIGVFLIYKIYSAYSVKGSKEKFLLTPNIHSETQNLEDEDSEHEMPEDGPPISVSMSQKCRNMFTDYYSKYMDRMIDGSPIPIELKRRLQLECSCGHVCQFFNDDRYYYYNHEKKGWDFGTKKNDKGNCYTSANVRVFGNKQLQLCPDVGGKLIPPIWSAEWTQRRLYGGAYKRRTDVDNPHVYP